MLSFLVLAAGCGGTSNQGADATAKARLDSMSRELSAAHDESVRGTRTLQANFQNQRTSAAQLKDAADMFEMACQHAQRDGALATSNGERKVWNDAIEWCGYERNLDLAKVDYLNFVMSGQNPPDTIEQQALQYASEVSTAMAHFQDDYAAYTNS